MITGAVAGALEVPAQAASNPHKTKKTETGKMAKSAFLLRLGFDELSCFRELTQIPNNRLLRLDWARSGVRSEVATLEALPFGSTFSLVMSLISFVVSFEMINRLLSIVDEQRSRHTCT